MKIKNTKNNTKLKPFYGYPKITKSNKYIPNLNRNYNRFVKITSSSFNSTPYIRNRYVKHSLSIVNKNKTN